MKNLNTIFAVAAATMVFSSCNKEPEVNYTVPPTVQDAGKITLQFSNYVGDNPLQLNQSYTSNGQQISFSEVKYVITNISMTKTDGTEVVYNQENLDKSGFVIDESNEASRTFVLDTMAAGKYRYIHFGLGVKESLNNPTNIQNRLPAFYRLTQERGMQWTWSNSFLFARFAGTYSAGNFAILIGNGQEGKKLHTNWNDKEGVNRTDTKIVGGEERKENWKQSSRDAFRYITLELPNDFTLVKDANTRITIKADLDKILNGANKINLSTTGNIPENQNNLDMALRISNNIGGRKNLSNKAIRIRQIKETNASADVDLENVTDNTVLVDSDTQTVDGKGMFSILSVQ